MSRRSVRKRRNALPPPAGRFDFDIDGWVDDAGELMSRPTSPYDISFDDRPLYVPPHLRRLLCPLPTDRLSTVHLRADAAHGFIHASREALAEKMDLELGTLALVGSTYYRLEEAAPGVPSFIDLATYPYEPGWSLRRAEPPSPRRGRFPLSCLLSPSALGAISSPRSR